MTRDALRLTGSVTPPRSPTSSPSQADAPPVPDGAVDEQDTSPGVDCDIWDTGHLHDPLVGRRRPVPDQLGGLGLWIANHLCDLVQLRSSPDGTQVRFHMYESSPGPNLTGPADDRSPRD